MSQRPFLALKKSLVWLVGVACSEAFLSSSNSGSSQALKHRLHHNDRHPLISHHHNKDRRPWTLFFNNHHHEDEEHPSVASSSSSSSSSPNIMMTIPVLSPIPNRAPLLLGEELVLDPPTPMQWYTLQEAAWVHQEEQQQQQRAGSQEECELDQPDYSAACIEAAPIVALLDETTGRDYELRSSADKKRYATLVAVVGFHQLKNNNNNKGDDGSNDDDHEGQQQQRIRLIGVGRAALSDFFYKVPTSLTRDAVDEQGYIQNMDAKVQSFWMEQQQLQQQKSYLQGQQGRGGGQEEECWLENAEDDDCNEDHGDDHDDDALRVNLLWARLALWQDDSLHNGRGRNSSPVHALSNMAAVAHRLQYLHADRQRLVSGLQAAQARLQWAGKRDDLLQDYDGLGQLFQKSSSSETGEGGEALCNAAKSPLTTVSTTLPSLLSLSLDEGNNYGMGFSAASVSTLPAMTKVWMETLSPYYSPTLQNQEEYYYEIYSFVTLLALQPHCLDSKEVAWCLQATNTVERLERAHDNMFRHVQQLQEQVRQASEDLLDCGEECTDLW